MQKVDIKSLDEMAMKKAKMKWDSIAKPLNSLGKLEDITIKMAGIFGTEHFNVDKKCTLVMCADNGIVAQNVTQTSSNVTRTVATEMGKNAGCISILSRFANADAVVVDVGMQGSEPICGVIDKKIAQGTKDFSLEPAMSKQQAIDAVQIGIDLVEEYVQKGYNVFSTGEMGIGNTTTSSAIAACLLQKNPYEVTGMGAGLSKQGVLHKAEIIRKALEFHNPDKNDAFDVLAKVGGFDIAALTGVFLGAAINRVPVLIDGFISSVAALLAIKINKSASDFMFATHISAEPAGKMLIEELGKDYLLDLNMCLGEGTGAAMAFPLIDMAMAIYNSMSSFENLSIEKYLPLN